ncbi:MAG: efflux RND transporter permease subunit, partial [Verrucomicrobiota bacterium]
MPLTPGESARVGQLATQDSMLAGRLIAPRGDVTGIELTFLLPESGEADPMEGDPRGKVMTAVREWLAPWNGGDSDLAARLTGDIAVNHAFEEYTHKDLQTLVPLMYGVIVLLLAILLRSFLGTLITVIVVGLSVVASMGVLGWCGFPISPPVAVAPNLIMTVAVADSVHFLGKYLRPQEAGLSKMEALRQSWALNVKPITLTSVTTAAGFLGMVFSESAPFRHLGIVAASGVVFAWLLSLVLIPALILALPIQPGNRKNAGPQKSTHLLHWFLDRPMRTLLVGGLVAPVVAGFAFKNEVNDRWLDYFSEDVPVYKDSHFTMERLTGTNLLEFHLDSGRPGGVTDPDYLRQVEQLRRWLEQQPGVTHVDAISEIFLRLNQHLHGDDETWFRLPESSELAAQYLLLYELSLPLGLDLNHRITIDKSGSRLVATIDNLSTVELAELSSSIEAWSRENLPAGFCSPPSGISTLFAFVSSHNIRQMILGTAVALLVITMVL